jgi:viroplasmin and RNaseH domain-containing protein
MKHDDVEFHAEREGSDHTEILRTWDAARAYMVGFAGTVDVVVWSQEGAHAYGGDDAVDSYLEDEEASVFERWTRKDPNELFNCEGRVP